MAPKQSGGPAAWLASATRTVAGRVLRAPACRDAVASLIEPRHYRALYPGLSAMDDAARHYMRRGMADGVMPNAVFDDIYYALLYPVRRGADAIRDYVAGGAAAGRRPNALFDVDWFAAHHRLDPSQRRDALAFYLREVRHRPLRTSPLFDAAWHRAHDDEADAFAFDSLSAYMASGLRKGVSPNCLFDGHWYALQHRTSGGMAGALRHYLSDGHDMRFDPHPLFDTCWYLKTYPEAAAGNPLAHYLEVGAAKGFAPHPLFDPAYYLSRRGARPQAHANALIDYLVDERNWDIPTHPLFDGAYYQTHNRDVLEHRINPLRHYVQSGAGEGRRPSPLFDAAWYLATYALGAAARLNPLIDYLTEGAAAGRNPNHYFDGRWYLSRNGDVAAAGVNPLCHYAAHGWREHRDPSPLFDASWYQARHPDANRGDVDPLAHFLTLGSPAGHIARPVDRITHDCDALDIPFEILRAPGLLAGREVCLFVTYAADGAIEDHALATMRAYKREGLTVVAVVVTEGIAVPVLPALEIADGVLVRINHGWDFAAWATALAVFPALWSARLLVLANDSLYGPTSQDGLSFLMHRVRFIDADLVALTDSYEVQHHMMSYFTALKPSGLRHPAVRAFWNGVRSNRDKDTVIREYEVRSIERCRRDNVSFDVVYPTAPDAEKTINPTLAGWQALRARGFPFFKVQLLRDFASAYGAGRWRGEFAAVPALAAAVDAHLAKARTAAPKPQRPVPAPRQRFGTPARLTTYYGATTSCRPADDTDLAVQIPFADASRTIPNRVAVIAHIFYPEFCADLLAAMQHAPARMDLFISTDAADKMVVIAETFRRYGNGSVEVRICPNVGRDIAPFLLAFRDVFERYETFLHLHSKQSRHQDDLAGWRRFLLANLVGSRDTIRSALQLLATDRVGLVFAQHFPAVRGLLNYGYDFTAMRDLLARCGVTLSTDLVLDFPSGSFFFGRTAALRPLLDLDLNWTDFPAESGQVDGTLAHAIERALLYVVEAAGYRWVKVADATQVPTDTLVPVPAGADLADVVARVHRPLLHNRIRPHKEGLLLPEVNPVLTRADDNGRLRLNLVVPTLQPAKMFGGMTTALRFFRELASSFGDDVDLRIVVVSERVDMQSMLQVPDYHLSAETVPSQALARTVLDVSEAQRTYVPVRAGDIFIATAWWTASAAFVMQDNQAAYFGARQPVVYLIQDHEPNFYNWSSRYDAAQRTYARGDVIPILNSEEFANYFQARYAPASAFVIPFAINSTIEAAIGRRPRERIILVYGRPSTARNAFEALLAGLALWQRRDPEEARQWQVVSLGEDYDPAGVSQVHNLSVHGKLSLEDYGEMLSRAAVGISLMTSPHPSYPPLEMAHAGLWTITNGFAGKDLARRAAGIDSIEDLSPETLATALGRATSAAAATIGAITPPRVLSSIPCAVPAYDPARLAQRLRSGWADTPPSRLAAAR